MRQVHELKTLSHEMLELRDVHLKEIRQLKEEALIRTSSNATTLSQMFPADEVAEAREEVATLQVRCGCSLQSARYSSISQSSINYDYTKIHVHLVVSRSWAGDPIC